MKITEIGIMQIKYTILDAPTAGNRIIYFITIERFS